MKLAAQLSTSLLVFTLLICFPLITTAECTTDDAICWCKAKGSPGTFADVSSACRNYYECVSSTQAYYRRCSFGTAFSDATKTCEWPDAITCGADTNINQGSSNSPSPKPPSTPTTSAISDYYPCTIGNAECYCSWKGILGRFADQSSDCKSYYNCGAAKSMYSTCQRGYVFNNAMKKCVKKGAFAKCSTYVLALHAVFDMTIYT